MKKIWEIMQGIFTVLIGVSGFMVPLFTMGKNQAFFKSNPLWIIPVMMYVIIATFASTFLYVHMVNKYDEGDY